LISLRNIVGIKELTLMLKITV